MSRHWHDIRRLAGQFRSELPLAQQPIPRADEIIALALKQTGLAAQGLDPSHPLLARAQAVLDPDISYIWYDQTLDASAVQLIIAHEIAHYRLHAGRSSCTASDATMGIPDTASTSGLAVVEGYGPEERREHEANLFARELLIPSADARTAFIDDGIRLSDFVGRTGLPEPVLAQHLVYSLLVSDLIDSGVGNEASALKPVEPDLDASQRAAAAAAGPLLVVAGPGTGKTRTLVGRVLHLLAKGIAPSSILALTYSNKAAEEMRDRIAAVAPDAAVKMWIGTFHAFGLEVLRRFGTRIGLPETPEVLNQVDSLLLLERDLNSLGLEQYLSLWEPARALRDILAAISRAKDELVSPTQYLALADQMDARATDASGREEAAQVREVARVYAHYEARVREVGALDFGDLVARAVEVLRHSDGIARAELRGQFQHILVDEFQDINHASAILLQELATKGEGLWAVGDVRQSVYRFRGASPSNVREFAVLFPGAKTLRLGTNYRAQPPIVATYAALASEMKATDGLKFEPWEVNRPHTNGEVFFRLADSGDLEGDGIAKEIQDLAARASDPIPYRQQAILCRSHLTLERIARRLELAGVPVLYLGDLFEREEVRDLLSLLALACEADGRSLVRVGRFPTYRIPLKDTLTLIRVAGERSVPFPRAFDLLDDASVVLSPEARSGLDRLRRDIDGLCYGKSAWAMLSNYLLDRSDYLEILLVAPGIQARQQRLAIFQFLQFALEQLDVSRIAAPENEDKDVKRIFLDFVRRLAMYGDERQLRQVPEWATALDAVRLMTIHASKGLEFRAVFIPYLSTAYMPSSQRPSQCKPPAGMLPAAETNTHTEEEECLFFVALSRARDVLCLSRAKRYGKTNRGPSKFLEMIRSAVPAVESQESDWLSVDGDNARDDETDPLSDIVTFTAKELDLYITCPRKFFYEHVLGLRDRVRTSAYIGFHRVVYAVLRWMRLEISEGRTVDAAAARRRVDEVWLTRGPLTHPYAALYEATAQALVARAQARLSEGLGEITQPTWDILMEHGTVSVEPEYVELLAGAGGERPRLRVRRIRTGKPTSGEASKEIYALYRAGARQTYPDADHDVETLFLTTDEVRPATLTDKTEKSRLGKYDRAIVGIRRGVFTENPSDHNCPRCPNFFICPMAEDGSTRPSLSEARGKRQE